MKYQNLDIIFQLVNPNDQLLQLWLSVSGHRIKLSQIALHSVQHTILRPLIQKKTVKKLN